MIKAYKRVKHLLLTTTLVFFTFSAAPVSAQVFCQAAEQCQQVTIDAPSQGDIYLNGHFSGHQTPSVMTLPMGEINIGIGLATSNQYLKKSVTINKQSTSIRLTLEDVQPANQWKALFVGVPEVVGDTSSGKCSSKFTKADLDKAYEFFKFNMRDHIEKFSFGTVKWDIQRQDLTKPVKLRYNPNNQWYTLEAEQGLAELSQLSPGMYDNIFLFWREQDGNCSFKSSYFGLAWLDPLSMETQQTGYVTVKFNPENIGVAAKLQEYKRYDPGVWTHEWLHVVIEQFYPNLNVDVPIPPKDALILHAAGAYGYQYPWMKWYKDLISGQVLLGNKYVGIGPEALLRCNIRQAALKQCS